MFYDSLKAFCEYCNESFFPRCTCGGAQISITNNGDLSCNDCGKSVDVIYCEEGHNHRLSNIIDVLGLYPSDKLLNKIKESLKLHFGLELKGSFYIHDGQLTLLGERAGGIITVDTIAELKEIADRHLDTAEYVETLKIVKGIQENCKRATKNKDCNACTLTVEPLCMMKLFSTNPMYRPSPHQASEFGDVNFSITLNGSSCELVGIAKSATKSKGEYNDVLTLSEASSREMLQQVLSATHDARIGVIATICPMRFHDQLVEELRYIAKLTGKPIVILDDMFMVKQYRLYNETQVATKC